LFAPPELVRTEVFAEVPAKLRKPGTPAERLAAPGVVVFRDMRELPRLLGEV